MSKKKNKKKKKQDRKNRGLSQRDSLASAPIDEGLPSFIKRKVTHTLTFFKKLPRKAKKIFLAIFSFILLLVLFLSKFVDAMEIAKALVSLPVIFFKQEQMENTDRALEKELESYYQQLKYLEQRCQTELRNLNLDLLKSTPGSASYQELETRKKAQEEQLRRIKSARSEAEKEIRTPAGTNARPDDHSAPPAIVHEDGAKSLQELQHENQKNLHTIDSLNRVVGERNRLLQKISAAETTLDDLVIEGDTISFHNELHSPSAEASRKFSPESLAFASPFDSTLQRGTWGQRQPLISGKRDTASLRQTITERYTNRLRAIYQNDLKKNPNLKGRITLRISLNSQGKVENLPEVIQSTLASPEMESRILASVAKWDGFGETVESQKNTVFKVTFKFGE